MVLGTKCTSGNFLWLALTDLEDYIELWNELENDVVFNCPFSDRIYFDDFLHCLIPSYLLRRLFITSTHGIDKVSEIFMWITTFSVVVFDLILQKNLFTNFVLINFCLIIFTQVNPASGFVLVSISSINK